MKQYLYSEARAGVCKGGGGATKTCIPTEKFGSKMPFGSSFDQMLESGGGGEVQTYSTPPPAPSIRLCSLMKTFKIIIINFIIYIYYICFNIVFVWLYFLLSL